MRTDVFARSANLGGRGSLKEGDETEDESMTRNLNLKDMHHKCDRSPVTLSTFVSTLIESNGDTKLRAYSVKIGSNSAQGSSSNISRAQVGGTLLEKRVEKHHQSLQVDECTTTSAARRHGKRMPMVNSQGGYP
jgi:hypothetical protein